MTDQKKTRSFKKKYRNLGLLIGVISMWIMFFVVYFGVMRDNAPFTNVGMGIMAIILAFMIYFL